MADKTINQLTEETTSATGDFAPIWDTSAGATKKVSLANIIPDDSVTTAKLADTSVTPAKTSNIPLILANVTLGSAGDTLSSGTIAAHDFLEIDVFVINSGQNDLSLRFNSDSGNNYSYDASTSANAVALDAGTPSEPQFIKIYVVNIAAQAKLGFYEAVRRGTAGAGNVAVSRTGFFKWENTSDAITSIQVINAGTGDIATGSRIIVKTPDGN